MNQFKSDATSIICICASVIALILIININSNVLDMVREIDALIVKVDDLQADY